LSNKKYFYIFLSILIGTTIIFLYPHKISQEILISTNGNFLFYNSPIAAKTKGYTYLAFVDNMGGVYVNKYYKNISKIPLKTYKVHDYKNVINKKIGSADDHSAPAIINDPFTKKVLLSTAYHGTDLFVYQYNSNKESFSLKKTLSGNFTYPRFITTSKETFLFARKMYKKGKKWIGSLVAYRSSDDFNAETLILDTYPGSVIYASRPFYCKNTVYFTYATHDYATGNMSGLTIIGWDTKSEKLVLNLDMSNYLDKNYFYNRPTGLAADDNKIVVATSFFDSKKNFKEEKLYIRENTVLILEVDIANKDNITVNVLHKNRTKAPYYNTDVFIDKNFNWIYFDDNKTISNRTVSDKCFHHRYMMYPTIIDDAILYTKVNNDHYSIRDFNNSIIECQHYAK